MRVLLLSLFFVVSFAANSFAISTAILQGVVAGSAGYDYSSILFWDTCEADPMSTGDCSAGDADPSQGGTPTYEAGSKYLGTNGLNCINQEYNYYTVAAGGDIIDDGQIVISYWFRVDVHDDLEYLGFSYSADSGGYLNAQQTGDWSADNGEFRVRFSDGTNAHSSDYTTTCDLSDDTWYFMVFKCDCDTDDDYSGTIYNTSLTQVCTISKTDGTMLPFDQTTMTDLQIGQAGAADTINIDIDNFVISNDLSVDPTDYANIDDYPGAEGGCTAQ